MSELAWFDGKVGPEFETARWVHDLNQQRILAHDVVGLAEQCAALFPAKGVFCGTMLAGFQGKREVLEDALEELRTLIRTMPDELCERVFAIIERAKLPLHLSHRRDEYEAAKAQQLAATVEEIRTRLASCAPGELVRETAKLVRRRSPIFGLALPATAFDWQELADLGRIRIRELLPTLPDDEALPLIEEMQSEIVHVDTRAQAVAIQDRRHRLALAADAASEPRNPDLEAAVDLDDAQGFAVLGDFLQRSGHPRGELIALQLRAETDPSIEVESFIAAHRDALLGSLARYHRTIGHASRPAFHWRRGYIDRLTLTNSIYPIDRTTLPQLVERAFRHPAGRFIRGVDLGIDTRRDDPEEVLAALVAHHTGFVRDVWIGRIPYDLDPTAEPYIGNVERVWQLPTLRSVTISGNAKLGDVVHPQLEKLAVWPTGMLAALTGLLAEDTLPALTDLALHESDDTDDLVNELVRAPGVAQLRRLDLADGILSDAGARTLASHARSLPRLEQLDVRGNVLTADGIAALVAAFPHVIATDQQELE